jgi:hypothetical protein
MSRALLATSLAFGLALIGCGSTEEEVTSPPKLGAEQSALSISLSQCDAPVRKQPDGTYAKLSDTGLFCDISQGTIDRHARAFAPEIPLWSDGADKSRVMRIPPGTQIDTTDMDKWVFPVGMKIWKEFRLNGKKIETRLLEKRPDKSWLMVAFQWNAGQTDAFPVPDGVRNANGTRHDIPPTAQCRECHGRSADVSIGVSALMLARSNPWATTLSDLIWERKLTKNPDRPIQFPGNASTSKALAYLQANCSSCHRGATAPEGLDLSTSVLDQAPEDTAVYRTAVNRALTGWVEQGLTLRVAPGSPDASGVVARMSTREPGDQMPEIATKIIDPAGIAIIREWIGQLR